MIVGRRQDLAVDLPSAFGHEPRVDKPGQPCRPLVDDPLVAEHVRHHLASRPAQLASPCHHRAAHRPTPACSRGLGTASTAARSRAGSGCTYTFDEDTAACPSRSATTSIPVPASARLLPQACRS